MLENLRTRELAHFQYSATFEGLNDFRAKLQL